MKMRKFSSKSGSSKLHFTISSPDAQTDIQEHGGLVTNKQSAGRKDKALFS